MNKYIYVFDVDGTLADLEHRRPFVNPGVWNETKQKHEKRWDRFYQEMSRDKPIHGVISVARMAWSSGATVLVSSGRPEFSAGVNGRSVTAEWLMHHGIEYHQMLMRKEGDFRGDDIVKYEILEQIRKEHGEPTLWFDDRDRVVKMLRENGVKVAQVAPGDF